MQIKAFIMDFQIKKIPEPPNHMWFGGIYPCIYLGDIYPLEKLP